MAVRFDDPRPGLLAERLEAIANWQRDHVCNNTPTSETLLQAAKHLRRLDRAMCCHGVIGCYGGDTCKSDHK